MRPSNDVSSFPSSRAMLASFAVSARTSVPSAFFVGASARDGNGPEGVIGPLFPASASSAPPSAGVSPSFFPSSFFPSDSEPSLVAEM